MPEAPRLLLCRRGKVTHVPETKRNGVGWAAKEIVDRARSIAKLEIELALIEVKRKLVRIAVGTGLGAGAAVVALFALGFLTAGAAAALALAVPVWAALLIVGGLLLGTTVLLAALALRSLRAGTPPVPKEAIEEARLTTEVLRHDGR
jgi:hypothetical protein